MDIQTTATEMFLKLDEKKRERVLSAAINEFADQNYNNASMNVVVKAAGISKGALFKYFRSKAGLFGFVYKMALGRVKDYLRRVRDESEAEDFFTRLEKVMLAGLDFIRAHPGLAAIYYRIVFTGDSPYKREIVEEVHRESLEFIESLIQKGIESGELRPDLDPGLSAFMVEAVVDRFVHAHHAQFRGRRDGDTHVPFVDPNREIAKIMEILKNGMALSRGSQDQVKQ
ncbi:MAG: TetR/AcrR family transcriptional regulator [Deltaproteobacteria bacterium]|nr:TetR/AcrR family transcriptional regulator [Deltaproteobacteria bacterium]